MKVVSIVVVDGSVVNESDLIASIASYDDFSAISAELRKALKKNYINKSQYTKIYKKITAQTGFSRAKFDYAPYAKDIEELVSRGYTVKAILAHIGEKDAEFKKSVSASGLTHFIATNCKDEKNKIRAIAKSKNELLQAYKFELKKLHFKGISDKDILRVMREKYPEDFTKITEAQIHEFIEANAKLDMGRKISLLKKPSLYDEHFDEIMSLYKSGMRVYDIWKTLRQKYPKLAKLQAPSLYHFIGNNALGKAKYMQEG